MVDDLEDLRRRARAAASSSSSPRVTQRAPFAKIRRLAYLAAVAAMIFLFAIAFFVGWRALQAGY